MTGSKKPADITSASGGMLFIAAIAIAFMGMIAVICVIAH